VIKLRKKKSRYWPNHKKKINEKVDTRYMTYIIIKHVC